MTRHRVSPSQGRHSGVFGLKTYATSWALLACLLLLSLPAAASPLDDAKAAGLVGERPDGYIGLVSDGAPADIRGLVSSINEKRRAKYETIAKKSGASVGAVAKLAGDKLIARTAKGQYVLDAAGVWTRK